jgi:hypothetical protein
VDVYTVSAEKRSGEPFVIQDVETFPIPVTQVNDEYIFDLTELQAAVYKIDVKPGMPLVRSLFFKEALTQTDRYYDVVADLFPVETRIGDYYDLRIVTSTGLDYIVLAKKRVIGHYGSTIRLVLTEEEIHQYQSSLVDSFVNQGTYLYVTTYIEPALQKRASIFYPVSDTIRTLMEVNPNIVKLAETDLLAKRRDAFEKGLEADSSLLGAIEGGRSWQRAQIVAAANARAKELEDERKNAEKNGEVVEAEPTTTAASNSNLLSRFPAASDDNSSSDSGPGTALDGNAEVVPEGLEENIDQVGGW